MDRTRRIIVVWAGIMLVVLGTGWALEKAFSGSHPHAGATIGEPKSEGDTVTAPLTRGPRDESVDRPTLPTDSSPE